MARELFTLLGRERARLEGELEAIEAKLMAWHRGDAMAAAWQRSLRSARSLRRRW